MKEITKHLHTGHGVKYDKAAGTAKYYKQIIAGSGPTEFDYTGYMNKTNNGIVNCYDQAVAVLTTGAILGIESKLYYIGGFGYLKKAKLVGFGDCNNPIHAGSINSNHTGTMVNYLYDTNKTTANADELRIEHDPTGTNRSRFFYHGLVKYSAVVYDATVGPHHGTETVAQFMKAAQDLSTVPEQDVEVVTNGQDITQYYNKMK